MSFQPRLSSLLALACLSLALWAPTGADRHAFAAETKPKASQTPVKKPAAAPKKKAAADAKAKAKAAAKAKPAASAMDKDWQKTFALIANHDDPVAQKLVFWLYATETTIPTDASALIDFARNNPDWPRLHLLRRKIEANIAGTVSNSDTVAWFDANPPSTHDGLQAYMKALIALNQPAQARAALEKFWNEANLNKNEVAALAGAFKSYFARDAHARRLDRLIWDGRYAEAEYMLAFVDADTRALGHARMSLARLAPSADADLMKVPARLRNDEGLHFERMRYRRRKNLDALELLYSAPKTQAHPDKWWPEIHILARREIEARNYKKAHDIAARHQTTKGFGFSQAEWLLGWLNLNYLNDTPQAYRHFDRLYRSVTAAVSRSRAAYWAGRAAEKLPDAAVAEQWHKISAYYPSTFYGQLSYLQVYGLPDNSTFMAPPVDSATEKNFDSRDLVRAIKLLKKVGLGRLADPFYSKLLALAKTDADFELVARLAREQGRLYYAVEANKEIQQTLGHFLFIEGYPLLSPAPSGPPEKALIHAIVHRESMFDTNALSTAGARGLMQLMPGTARMMAKKTGRSYTEGNLTADPRYNVALGSAYLAQLVDSYGGYYPMAIAAYNAGPGRVTEWISLFGDPRLGQMDTLDWIEHIPIYETRNYVQRVMESYFMYRLRLLSKPKTVLDFAPPARR